MAKKKRIKVVRHVGQLVATSLFGARTASRIEHEKAMLERGEEVSPSKLVYYGN